MDDQGHLTGHTLIIPRTYEQRHMSCVDTDAWTQQWEARTTFDDETNHVTVKLRFRQSPMQNQITYPNRSASTTHPSFQSDSIQIPFDGFSLPATDDAQQQCNFSFGPRRNVITVTLIASKDAD